MICSLCGREIENRSEELRKRKDELLREGKDISKLDLYDGDDVYNGTICMACKRIYCAQCVQYGPGPCPNCGNDLYPLMDSTLKGYPIPPSFLERARCEGNIIIPEGYGQDNDFGWLKAEAPTKRRKILLPETPTTKVRSASPLIIAPLIGSVIWLFPILFAETDAAGLFFALGILPSFAAGLIAWLMTSSNISRIITYTGIVIGNLVAISTIFLWDKGIITDNRLILSPFYLPAVFAFFFGLIGEVKSFIDRWKMKSLLSPRERVKLFLTTDLIDIFYKPLLLGPLIGVVTWSIYGYFEESTIGEYLSVIAVFGFLPSFVAGLIAGLMTSPNLSRVIAYIGIAIGNFAEYPLFSLMERGIILDSWPYFFGTFLLPVIFAFFFGLYGAFKFGD